jgi:hypothetical protein
VGQELEQNIEGGNRICQMIGGKLEDRMADQHFLSDFNSDVIMQRITALNWSFREGAQLQWGGKKTLELATGQV